MLKRTYEIAPNHRTQAMLLAVADAIEEGRLDLKWDYGTFYKSLYRLDEATREAAICCTAACLAGWAVYLVDGIDRLEAAGGNTEWIRQRAAEIMGLLPEEARYLFHSVTDLYKDPVPTLRKLALQEEFLPE